MDLAAEDLVGTWLLARARVSCLRWARRVPGSGVLIYTSAGYVSATIRVTVGDRSGVGRSIAHAGPFTR